MYPECVLTPLLSPVCTLPQHRFCSKEKSAPASLQLGNSSPEPGLPCPIPADQPLDLKIESGIPEGEGGGGALGGTKRTPTHQLIYIETCRFFSSDFFGAGLNEHGDENDPARGDGEHSLADGELTALKKRYQ